VVVISGAPGVAERKAHPLLHHKSRELDTQQRIFEQLTVASAVLDDPYTAERDVDRVLAAATEQRRPVYLEIPRDMVGVPTVRHHAAPPERPASDAESLREAVARLAAATQPVILAGVDVQRYGLQDRLLGLARTGGIPVADTLMSKSVIGEREPAYLGLYQGG
jgi:indolepyruvate decarboxylase